MAYRREKKCQCKPHCPVGNYAYKLSCGTTDSSYVMQHLDIVQKICMELSVESKAYLVILVRDILESDNQHVTVVPNLDASEYYDEVCVEIFEKFAKVPPGNHFKDYIPFLKDLTAIGYSEILLPYLGINPELDPFNHHLTKETFRRLFGKPDDPQSFLKVCLSLGGYRMFLSHLLRAVDSWIEFQERCIYEDPWQEIPDRWKKPEYTPNETEIYLHHNLPNGFPKGWVPRPASWFHRLNRPPKVYGSIIRQPLSCTRYRNEETSRAMMNRACDNENCLCNPQHCMVFLETRGFVSSHSIRFHDHRRIFSASCNGALLITVIHRTELQCKISKKSWVWKDLDVILTYLDSCKSNITPLTMKTKSHPCTYLPGENIKPSGDSDTEFDFQSMIRKCNLNLPTESDDNTDMDDIRLNQLPPMLQNMYHQYVKKQAMKEKLRHKLCAKAQEEEEKVQFLRRACEQNPGVMENLLAMRFQNLMKDVNSSPKSYSKNKPFYQPTEPEDSIKKKKNKKKSKNKTSEDSGFATSGNNLNTKPPVTVKQTGKSQEHINKQSDQNNKKSTAESVPRPKKPTDSLNAQSVKAASPGKAQSAQTANPGKPQSTPKANPGKAQSAPKANPGKAQSPQTASSNPSKSKQTVPPKPAAQTNLAKNDTTKSNASKQSSSQKASQAEALSDSEDSSDDGEGEDANFCYNCCLYEHEGATLKACKRCLDEDYYDVHYYCSRECQLEDWKREHRAEHIDSCL